ncbi:cyclic nucleotide-gated ion channel 1-like [Carya illinoinensis]|uniref:cyclic nucleotide-gated ion channel 1-like n=1 Tax=Carya illinoinensis TaxID=32201 RepID=UPI001C729234|nr:cyclic nucleotide-gated ion channel 1-like [Carya illinoinensis]
MNISMRTRRPRRQDSLVRDENVDRQTVNNDGVDSKEKKTTTKTFLDPHGQFLRIWRMIFFVSCMMAVLVDPLFFYLPVINEKNKCFVLDKRLRVVAICLRTATDLIYIVNIVLQFLCPYIDEAAPELGRLKVVTDSWLIAKRYILSRYFPIDILAILPLPQVLIPKLFSEIRGSESFYKRILLNIVLFQYVPRLIRISMFIRAVNKHSRVGRVKAALNFFLYIMSSHVVGAFWYFFSIEREITCWHSACERNDTPCTLNSFNCDDHVHSSGNYTFLNDYCPVETKDGRMPFDFGIYLDAIKSGIVASRNFPEKILYCSWWGLRNLSSFGQNLHTSTNFWENAFAVFISISGLLLFLYLIGNVQTCMQLVTERRDEIIQKVKSKERDIELWISRNGLNDLKREIMAYIRRVILQDNIDVDAKNPLPHLSTELQRDIKCHLCLPLLKKVPMFETESERLLQSLCSSLKPVYYNKHTYIVREGEPLVEMLFITQGTVINFRTNTCGDGTSSLSAKFIERGHFLGEELLDWGFKGSPTTNLSDLPISNKTFKTDTNVEAFALMANDLKTLISQQQNESASTSQAVGHDLKTLISQQQNESASTSQAIGQHFRVRKNSDMSTHMVVNDIISNDPTQSPSPSAA